MNYSHIYIDESGDLGRSKKSSRYIIVASIATNHPRPLDKITRKVWKTKQHIKHAGELHAIDANDSTRHKLLTLLTETDAEISFTLIDKVSNVENLHRAYYRLIAEQIKKYAKAQVVVVDKRDTVKKRQQIIRDLRLVNIYRRVVFADSRAVRQLQAVDFVGWSLFQLFENENATYIEGLKDQIKESLPL